MTTPVLFHDPTSEPSRTVHWFCVETGIELELHYTWLARREQARPEFAAINPRHQVPALRQGDFCLSEATAIIRYLAEINRVEPRWLGASVRERAHVNMLLSWYHTNLRTKAALDYMLPVLLFPGYKGDPAPPGAEVDRLRAALGKCIAHVDAFLGDEPYLGGPAPSVADLLFAAELFALDCDPHRDVYFSVAPVTSAWLERMRELPTYEPVHRPWNAVAPMVRERLSAVVPPVSEARWVADVCERVIAQSE